MKYVTRILIALVVLAMLASCTPAEPTVNTPHVDYPYTVLAPDGTDITLRVEELWTFANELYAPPPQGGDDILLDVRTGYVAYQSIDDRFDSRRDYFTSEGMAQLDCAYTAVGLPVFYTFNTTTYRRPDMKTELVPGDITDITTLSTTADRIVLSIEYTDPEWYLSDSTEITEADKRYVNFTIELSEGVWKIADYVYPDVTDGIIYTSLGKTPKRHDFVPHPTRQLIDDNRFGDYDYYRALLRVYLLTHLDEVGLDRDRILIGEPDSSGILRDVDGNEYLVAFRGYADMQNEDEPLYALVAQTDENGDWQPASEAYAVDDETAERAKNLIKHRPVYIDGVAAAPPKNMRVIRSDVDDFYFIFAETTVSRRTVELRYSVEMFDIGFGVSAPLAKTDDVWEKTVMLHDVFPSRSDLLRLCSDSALLREMRRVYFYNNCSDFGIGSANILADTIEWESDATFTFSTDEGMRYSVTFYDIDRVAELPYSSEIFTVTELDG